MYITSPVPMAANGSRFSPCDPVRETGALHAGALIATIAMAPARCGAFGDEWRIVARRRRPMRTRIQSS